MDKDKGAVGRDWYWALRGWEGGDEGWEEGRLAVGIEIIFIYSAFGWNWSLTSSRLWAIITASLSFHSLEPRYMKRMHIVSCLVWPEQKVLGKAKMTMSLNCR